MIYPLDEARREVISALENALSQLYIGLTQRFYKKLLEDGEVTKKLENPPENMGDFAFPCYFLASELKKSPNNIANDIVKYIKKSKWIEKVEAKGPYVNFFLNIEYLKTSTINSILKNKDKYGSLSKKNKKVIVEHTSANPNGPLHVGRARNPIIGDTLVRIFKAAGYTVESQFYLDDMGKQVAILTWGINNLNPKEVPKSEYNKPDHKKVGFYQLANKLMEKDNKIARQIDEIVKRSEEGDKKTIEHICKAYTPVLEGIKDSLNRINITIDEYIPESNFIKDKSVDYIVEKLKQSKYCNNEEDAFFLDIESFGVMGRNTKFFFIRNDGTTLYATRDVAYHLWKAKNADILVNVLGEDHKLESKQVEIALNIVGAKIVPKVIFYSFVSLPEGKMSTRRGLVVYIDDLIDECIKRAYDEVKKRRGEDFSEKKMKEIAEIVGIGALRYNIIKVQPEKDIVFKWEEALNFEGNASPFIQYSHARACSILSKKQDELKDIDATLLNHDSEVVLIKKLALLPIVVDDACEGCKPHIITSYLFDIASQFNQFYRDCPVLPEKEKKLRQARLALVDATRIVLKNGLALLGIVAPEEM